MTTDIKISFTFPSVSAARLASRALLNFASLEKERAAGLKTRARRMLESGSIEQAKLDEENEALSLRNVESALALMARLDAEIKEERARQGPSTFTSEEIAFYMGAAHVENPTVALTHLIELRSRGSNTCIICLNPPEAHATGCPRQPWYDCTCHHDCGEDSFSGEWHQHEDEPCPVHPDAPMCG